MMCSVCIASYDKPKYLARTLESIFRQSAPFSYEVIVVDDGSPTGETRELCRQYRIRYARIDREPGFRNQSAARNLSYRMAVGEVIISQADDVTHVTSDCIARLVKTLMPGNFLIANVINVDQNNQPIITSGIVEYTGIIRQKPYFFLGSLFRKDVYAAGGCDEEFMIAPAYEDDWFGDCLTKGLGLTPVYSTEIVGHHQDHLRSIIEQDVTPSKILYAKKRAAAECGKIPWQSSRGPWPI